MQDVSLSVEELLEGELVAALLSANNKQPWQKWLYVCISLASFMLMGVSNVSCN